MFQLDKHYITLYLPSNAGTSWYTQAASSVKSWTGKYLDHLEYNNPIGFNNRYNNHLEYNTDQQ